MRGRKYISLGVLVASLFALGCIVKVCESYARQWRHDLSVSNAYVYTTRMCRSLPSPADLRTFNCTWCHKTNCLNRMVVVKLDGDCENHVVLCERCNFVLGRRNSWRLVNPDTIEIVDTYTNAVPAIGNLFKFEVDDGGEGK